MGDGTKAGNAEDAAHNMTRWYVRLLVAVLVVIAALGILLVVYTQNAANATNAVKEATDQRICEGNVARDTYQLYWRDLSMGLDGLRSKDQAKINVAVDKMQAVPDLNAAIAVQCPRKK